MAGGLVTFTDTAIVGRIRALNANFKYEEAAGLARASCLE